MVLTTYRRTLSVLLSLTLAAGLAGCAYLDLKQRQLIFMPTAEIAGTPADFNLEYEEVWLPVKRVTAAGEVTERINGWWIPSQQADALALLYLRGNSWNIGDSAYNTARLQRMGFSVLTIDYRGFGKSEGEFPSEGQVYEDAQVAWNYLKQLEPEPRRRFLYGHSLGAAVAIELAVRNPDAAGLIVEAAFSSALDMAKRSKLYRLLPLRWILTQRFDSLAKVGSLKMPVLFLHGVADTVVPSVMSERLHAAAREPKRLVLIPEAGHSSIAVVALHQYRQAVRDFVKASRVGSPE